MTPQENRQSDHGIVAPADFSAAWWCRNPHAQTLWPYVFRTGPQPTFRRQRFQLPDGDYLDLDWAGDDSGPISVLLHGLEGSSHSHYIRRTTNALLQHKFRVVVMHFRGCSGVPNALPRSYHSGDTGDIATVVQTLCIQQPQTRLVAIGFSLGANVLLKWLGETRKINPLTAAVAVSTPFELHHAADRMEQGLSKLYQWQLVGALRRSTAQKFRHMPCPVDLTNLSKLKTFRQFDGQITAPLHGFTDAEDYYQRCSSRPFLRHICVPTLILHARDDPLMTLEVVPSASELSPSIRLELSDRGGHAGFVSGVIPGRSRYWLDKRIPEYLSSHISNSG
ncbi:MAG: hydrolase [Gammaproteobacteria bacterium]|nr:hydrolase [Gammaproteobacteria bacterium]